MQEPLFALGEPTGGGSGPSPAGFRYQTGVVPLDEEQELAMRIAELPLKEFKFHSYTGRRRVISFGWHYDFGAYSLLQTDPIPAFLIGLRDRAAAFAGLEPQNLAHVLITEYRPGTTIGWHRDKAVFEDVAGISLLSSCRFRFRRKIGTAWERHSIILEPRSAYLLCGPSRTDWEHSIPAVDSLRYSITFRTLR